MQSKVSHYRPQARIHVHTHPKQAPPMTARNMICSPQVPGPSQKTKKSWSLHREERYPCPGAGNVGKADILSNADTSLLSHLLPVTSLVVAPDIGSILYMFFSPHQRSFFFSKIPMRVLATTTKYLIILGTKRRGKKVCKNYGEDSVHSV